MRRSKAKRNKATRQPASLRPVPYPDKATLATMNEERERLGIYLVEIATEAAKTTKRKRGTCSMSTVSCVFSGLTKSRNILDAYARVKNARLTQAREARNGDGAAA